MQEICNHMRDAVNGSDDPSITRFWASVNPGDSRSVDAAVAFVRDNVEPTRAHGTRLGRILSEGGPLPWGVLGQPWSSSALPMQVAAFEELIRRGKTDGDRVLTAGDLEGSSPSAQQRATPGLVASKWNNASLIRVLAKIASTGGDPGSVSWAAAMLGEAAREQPELVFVALLTAPRPWGAVHTDVAAKLLNVYFSGTVPPSLVVFRKLWQLSRALVVAALVDFYRKSEIHAQRIVDILIEIDWNEDAQKKALQTSKAAHDALTGNGSSTNATTAGQRAAAKMASSINVATPVLIEFLSETHVEMAFDIAAQAARRYVLDYEEWLAQRGAREVARLRKAAGVDATVAESQYIRELLAFLEKKVAHDLERQERDSTQQVPPIATISLGAFAVSSIFRYIRRHYETLAASAEDVVFFKDVRTHALQLYPRLMNFMPDSHHSEPGLTVASFSPEIEERVVLYFKSMYEGSTSVEDVVQYLIAARSSSDPETHEFIACFLHDLFDEHRFFNTYPPMQLSLTAQLIGDLIQHQLIGFVPLGVAVRYVLNALQHPDTSKWFQFGIEALARFVPRLVEWPALHETIQKLPAVLERLPQLAVEPAFPDAQRADLPFPAIRTDLGARSPQVPPKQSKDRLLFIINNLTGTTLDSLGAEVKSVLSPEYVPWFAVYLVNERVALEPNNHELYLGLVDAVDSATLNERILLETITCAGHLFNGTNANVSQSQERATLKTLGSWLGLITLARAKPVLHDHCAIKELLIQGYNAQRLTTAIPFVCKILEHAKGTIFHPPNPWTKRMLACLSELYQFADLKLNLKFEIEVLCKALSLDIKTVPPATDLRVALAVASQEEASDLRSTASAHVTPAQVPMAAPPMSSAVPSQTALNFELTRALQDLPIETRHASLLILALGFNPDDPQTDGIAPAFVQGFTVQLIAQAIERAIRLVVHTVVERSVTIATIASRELVLKDFATEPSFEKLQGAAHAMARTLVGSLAKFTCKDPLNNALVLNLKQLFLENSALYGSAGSPLTSVPDPVVDAIALDNLDKACGIVEHVAMTQAVADVDASLAPAYAARQSHPLDRPFLDTQAVHSVQMTQSLPPPLRFIPGVPLSQQQLAVYQDFDHVHNGEFSDWQIIQSAHQSALTQATGAARYSIQTVLADAAAASDAPDTHGEPLDATTASLLVQMCGSTVALAKAEMAHEASQQEAAEAFMADAVEVIALIKLQADKESGLGLPLCRFRPDSALRSLVAALPLLVLSVKTRDALTKLALAGPSSLAYLTGDSLLATVDEELFFFKDAATLSTSPLLQNIILTCAKKILNPLFASDQVSTLAIEALVVALRRLCALSISTLRDVREALRDSASIFTTSATGDIRRNIPVVSALLNAGLLSSKDLDTSLTKQLYQTGGNDLNLIDFCALLLLQHRHDRLQSVLDALAVLVANDRASELATRVVVELHISRVKAADRLRAVASAAAAEKQQQQQQQHVQQQVQQHHQPAQDVTSTLVSLLTQAGHRVAQASSQTQSADIAQFVDVFATWVDLFCTSPNLEAAFVDYVVQLQTQRGILNGEDSSSLLFRVSTRVFVQAYALVNPDPADAEALSLAYTPADAFAKFVVFMTKLHTDPSGANNDKAKVHYISKLLTITLLELHHTHNDAAFSPKPFFHFFSVLLHYLHDVEPALGSAYTSILFAISHQLDALSPAHLPKFALSWLSIVSHRQFFPRILAVKDRDIWIAYYKLLVSLLKFLAPYLKRMDLPSQKPPAHPPRKPNQAPAVPEGIRVLYKGTVHLFQVLLSDFPDFLAQAGPGLLQAVPPKCIYLMNIIATATPAIVRGTIPDPASTTSLEAFDKLPFFLLDFTHPLSALDLRAQCDKFLQIRHPSHTHVAQFGDELVAKLAIDARTHSARGPNTAHASPPSETQLFAVFQAIATYAASSAINQQKANPGLYSGNQKSTAALLLRYLLFNPHIHPGSRYLLVSAIVNQLRWPMAHTAWFSQFLFHMYAEAPHDSVREQILRVLFDRIIAHRPHPFGVLYVFHHLLTNPKFNVHDAVFVQRSPQVQALFAQARNLLTSVA